MVALEVSCQVPARESFPLSALSEPELSFRLAMLIAMAVLGTAMAVAYNPWREHRAEIRIEQGGGVVGRDYFGPDWVSRALPYRWIKHLSDVTRVDFRYDEGSQPDLEVLVDLPYLDTVSLEGAAVNDDNAAPLSELTGVAQLVLVKTSLTDASLHHLGVMRRLRFLSLAKSPVTGSGLKHLKDLPQLQGLNLLGTEARDETVSDLASFSRLESLQLKGTQISDQGLRYLSKLASLRTLGLSKTRITDDGLKELAGMVSLRSIDLGETSIGDAGLRHLCALPMLEHITLKDTYVTQDGVDALMRAYPRLSVSWR